MLGEIDLSLKPRKLELFLAKPNKQIIAKLKDAHGSNNSVKLGGINELTFSFPIEVDINGELVRSRNVDLIHERYLIKVKSGNQHEWYLVTKITDVMDDNGDIRQVQCFSLGYELADKFIHFYEGMSKNATQVLTDALTTSLWKIGYVDGSFDTMFRSFDISSTTVLDFVIQIAKTFGAVIVWDTENRKINLYNPDNIGINRGLKIKYGRYLKSLNKESDSTSMVTRLKVFGNEGLSIQRVNPTGSNYIEDFSYFLYPYRRFDWTNLKNVTYYANNGLIKTSGASAWWDGGAVSVQKIEAGQNGFVEFTADSKNTHTICGLSNGDSNQLHSDIDFGIYLCAGTLILYEKGINVATAGTYISGDVLKVSVANNRVTYYQNSNLVYTSTQTPTFPLLIDTAIYELDAKIKNIKFNIGGQYLVTSHSHYMTDSLCEAIMNYNTFIETKKGTFDYLLSEKKRLEGLLTQKYNELTQLEEELAIIQDNLDIALANGQPTEDLIIQKNAKQAQIAEKEGQISSNQALINSTDAQIGGLRNSISIEANFSPEQILERNQYIIEKEIIDEKYINDEDLYKFALKKFESIRTPQTVIKIDIINLMSIVEEQRNWDKLNIGDIITIYYEKLNINVEAKIIETDLNYEDDSVTLTIANIKDIETDEEKLIKMLYKSISTSKQVDMNKYKWNNAVSEANEVSLVINNMWDATKRAIEGGVNESVSVSRRGIIIKDPNDPARYLVAQHGVLALTNDNGNSWKHAITPEGVVGERIIGQLFIGNQLMIDATDDHGVKTFTVDNTGVKIKGTALEIIGGLDSSQVNGVLEIGEVYNGVKIDTTNGLIVTRSDNKSRVVINAISGIKIQTGDGTGAVFNDKFFADDSGNLTLRGNIIIGYDNNIFKADSNGIYVGHAEFASAPFRVNMWGGLTASKATITGSIDCTSLKINGVDALTADFKIRKTRIEKLTANEIDVTTLYVGVGGIRMGSSAEISWQQVTDKPTIPTLPGYITATKITQTEIESPTIRGAEIIGGTFKTNSSTTHRLEMNTYGIAGYYNSTNEKHGIGITSDNFSRIGFWYYGAERGHITGFAGDMSISTDGSLVFTCGDYSRANFTGCKTVDFTGCNVVGLSGGSGGVAVFG